MCESHTAILLCVILRGSKNKADGLPKKGPTYYSPIISMLSCMQGVEITVVANRDLISGSMYLN
jgi:hypothetical protein